jgi:hypothetical protein
LDKPHELTRGLFRKSRAHLPDRGPSGPALDAGHAGAPCDQAIDAVAARP